MKIISKCEREFLSECISKKEKRLDGRSLKDGRTLDITFGQDWGSCSVQLGNTKVFCQVSAEVTEPKVVTPTEGRLFINLELSMASPDLNRISDEWVVTQRCLERCVQESKCIDVESLCIVAGSKVWTIRVDIHAINNDGNLLECASIAAISALAHFKRPDVTVVGTDVTVHSLDDREPVPLNLHHLPISVNLALYEQGNQILVDPTEIEEQVADGCYIIGMNSHQEICFITRKGILLLSESTIQRCEDTVARRAQVVTQIIRKAIDDDAYKRATKAPVGFVNMLQTGDILGARHPIHNFDISDIKNQLDDAVDSLDVEMVDPDNHQTSSPKTYPVQPSKAAERAMHIVGDTRTVFEGGPSKWGVQDDDSDSDDSSSETEHKSAVKQEQESDEETGFVDNDSIDIKPSNATRSWYSKDPFS